MPQTAFSTYFVFGLILDFVVRNDFEDKSRGVHFHFQSVHVQGLGRYDLIEMFENLTKIFESIF